MRTWTTPDGIVFEGEQTGDGRIIADGALYWSDAPNGWPLRWDRTDEGFHDGAMLVGAIAAFDRRDGGAIAANGSLDDENEDGAELARQLDADQPLGVSVDMDDMEVEFIATDAEDEGEVVLLAAALPHGRLVPAAGDDGTVRWGLQAPGLRALAASAGLVAAAGDGEPEDGVVLFTDATDALVMRVTRARLRGATVVDIPAFDRARIVLDPAGSDSAEGTGDDAEGDGDALAAAGCLPCLAAEQDALVAASAPVRPPAAWFTDPHLDGPTPLTITDDGRVFGHIATWGQCHTGSDGACVLTPRSRSGYAYFRTGGAVRTAEGTDVPVGALTFGGGHADTRLSFNAALEHYDDVSTRAADVVAGEDAHGVWIAGAVRPEFMGDELQLRRLRGSAPSGDWRWIDGGLELILAHSVNTPGFPVVRAHVAAGGRVDALVAAGAAPLARLRHESPAAQTLTSDVIAAAVERGIDAWERRQAEQADQAARKVAAARLRGLDPNRDRLRALTP